MSPTAQALDIELAAKAQVAVIGVVGLGITLIAKQTVEIEDDTV